MSDWVDLFDGQTLAGWSGWSAHDRQAAADAGTDHEWCAAGAVRADRADGAEFTIEPGTGVLVNGAGGRTVDLLTAREHGDCELHVEFCVARGSNSGVYLQGQYEIQILDDRDATGEPTYQSSGAVYGRRDESTKQMYDGGPPLERATGEPGEWQAFDVVFRAPRFDGTGAKTENACFEKVVYNGVLVQDGFACTGPTGGPWSVADIPRGPLRLQGDHGPVAFRKLRMRYLD